MRAVSMKSLKSDGGRSELGKSTSLSASEDAATGGNFENFIQESCKQYECPISIIVVREIIQRERGGAAKGTKQKNEAKFKRKSAIQQLVDIPSAEIIPEPSEILDETALLITAYYDVYHQLMEININKYHHQPIPRMLLQIIALKVPMCRQLTKFTIKRCRMDMYTLYELHKILLLTNITDVCLDHSPLKEGNYDILLSECTSLRNLSLARCNINDVVCQRISTRLRHLEPAENNLLALNLSSNHITDVGAQHLGEALRDNRHLRYLNVADNHIGDDGVCYIFDILIEFPLTTQEVIDKGKRYISYLKKKHTLYIKYMHKFENKSEENFDSRRMSKKGTGMLEKSKPTMKRHKSKDSNITSEDYLRTKAEAMALEILGPFQDPFSSSTVVTKEGELYSIGNFVLCYLNIAYNNLTFRSVQKLLAVLAHQEIYRNETMCGLMNVLIDGNNIPVECDEYIAINKLLGKTRFRGKKNGR